MTRIRIAPPPLKRGLSCSTCPNTMNEIYIPPGGPPQHGPSREIYAAMGEHNIFAMCRDFYRELEKSSVTTPFP